MPTTAPRRLPDLAARLAAGCPRATAPDPAERCFVYFPQLLGRTTRAARTASGARMPTAARKPSPYELASSEAINAMIARVAPAILELLADGMPRTKAAIVAALAGRHDKQDVVIALVRLAVTGEVVETGSRYTLGPAGEDGPPEAA